MAADSPLILPADVLFVWSKGFISEAIECVTHGPSHCAMFVSGKIVEEAQGGRKVGECDLSFYTSSTDRLEVWGDPELTDTQRRDMVEFAHTLYGKRYDYKLIPLELLHFELGLSLGWYHDPDEEICSVNINTIALRQGRKWSKVSNPAPVDLLKGGVLKKKLDLGGVAGAGR